MWEYTLACTTCSLHEGIDAIAQKNHTMSPFNECQTYHTDGLRPPHRYKSLCLVLDCPMCVVILVVAPQPITASLNYIYDSNLKPRFPSARARLATTHHHTVAMASKLAPTALRSASRAVRPAWRHQQRFFTPSATSRSDSLNVVCIYGHNILYSRQSDHHPAP